MGDSRLSSCFRETAKLKAPLLNAGFSVPYFLRPTLIGITKAASCKSLQLTRAPPREDEGGDEKEGDLDADW
eukprot:16219966-Heterocapsa_arctica.AAC.1